MLSCAGEPERRDWYGKQVGAEGEYRVAGVEDDACVEVVGGAALQGELARYDDAIWRLGADRLPDAATPTCASDLAGCRDVNRTARDLGLDDQRFASAMKRCAATITASSRELATLNVTDQAYFVNGRMVDPWGLELAGTFQNLIEVELAKARRRIAVGATPARYYEQWVLDVGATR